MGYSVGGNTIPLVQDNSISALNAVNKAYDSMNSGMEKLANIPFIGRKMVQDNADARYSAALNKFSNDPEGLARALANGDISTTDVTADTLNQTQNRLSDIGKNYTRAYLQNRQEIANNYFDKNGALYQEAVNEAQAGHPEKLAQLRTNLGEVPWEVGYEFAKLNGQTEKDNQRSMDIQGGALALQRQALADMREGNAAAWALMDPIRKIDFTQNPTRVQAEVNEVLNNNPDLVQTLLKTKAGYDFLLNFTGSKFYQTPAAGVDKTQDDQTKVKTFGIANNSYNYFGK